MNKQAKQKRIRHSIRRKLRLSVKQVVLICASAGLSIVLGAALVFNLGDTRTSVAASIDDRRTEAGETAEMNMMPVGNPFSGSSYALQTRLLYFKARLSGDIVSLEWETSGEVSGVSFSVERSQNGKNFVSLAEKPGAGNNSLNVFYSTTDENPVIGLNYYRLKYTDAEGKCSYSAIETFKNEKNDERKLPEILVKSIYPNPFANEFRISFTMEFKAEVDFVLLDANGRELVDELIQAKSGLNNYTFRSNGSLKRGVYFVNLVCGEQKIVQKVIKE